MVEKDWMGIIVAIAEGTAQQYESIGIVGVTFNPNTSSLVFQLADGSTQTVQLNISAQGVSFSNSGTGLVSSNVQTAIAEIQENLENAVASELLKNIADENLSVNGTTAQFMSDVVGKDYNEGTILVGEVNFSDLPANMVNAELTAELKRASLSIQVWHLVLTSTNKIPYIWTLEYESNNTALSGNVWNARPLQSQIDNMEATLEEVLQREVLQLTNSEMIEALSNDGYSDGQIAICKDDTGYFLGHIYQFKILEGPEYSWKDITTSVGISNSYMGNAISTKMYVNGQVFICTDNGTYLQGHIYKYNVSSDTPAVLSWIDITPTYPTTMVEYFNDTQKTTFLATASSNNVGKTIISYEDGNVYQLKSTENPAGSGNYEYSWEQKTNTLPVNGTHYLGGGTNITIDDGGTWIIFGDVTNLNIATTTGVVITILGTLTNMALPSTTGTVLIHSAGYNGAEITTKPQALADGSNLNGIRFGGVDI